MLEVGWEVGGRMMEVGWGKREVGMCRRMMEVGWGKREVRSEKMEARVALDAGGGRRTPVMLFIFQLTIYVYLIIAHNMRYEYEYTIPYTLLYIDKEHFL